MIESAAAQLVEGGWIQAAGRVLFVLLIYVFLFHVFRATVRELAVTAARMPGSEGAQPGAVLIVEDPGDASLRAGDALRVPPMATLGRGAANDLVIDDPHVSAHHAALQFERGQWWLRDLESSNGTLLNGEPVRTVVALRAGDVLQCGRVRFRFVPTTPTVPSVTASV